MNRMASYAASQGIISFGAMAPRTLEGQVVLSAFERAVQRNGGAIAATERYKQTFVWRSKRRRRGTLRRIMG